jgi:hypothetical protein
MQPVALQRGGFHDREHAKKSLSMPEVFSDMRNFVEVGGAVHVEPS